MRFIVLLVTALGVAGCWGDPVSQSSGCHAWVACIRALDDVADAGEPANLDRFVEGGFCWNNPSLAEGCISACDRGLARLRERNDVLPEGCKP